MYLSVTPQRKESVMALSPNPEERLRYVGIKLPQKEGPAFDYLPIKTQSGTIYLAGTLAKENGIVQNLGRVGA